MHKDGKWAKSIIALQEDDGKWGCFHSLSKFYNAGVILAKPHCPGHTSIMERVRVPKVRHPIRRQ